MSEENKSLRLLYLGHRQEANLYHVFRHIIKSEGVRGLSKGLHATIWRDTFTYGKKRFSSMESISFLFLFNRPSASRSCRLRRFKCFLEFQEKRRRADAREKDLRVVSSSIKYFIVKDEHRSIEL